VAPNHPERPDMGSREVVFGRELYIDRDDFMESPPKNYYRLFPGGEVRLRYGYWIKCTEMVKNEDGHIVSLNCTYDADTKGGNPPKDGRKVKGTLHWVTAAHALEAEFRLYDRLFTIPTPEDEAHLPPGGTFRDVINPNSLKVVRGFVEQSLSDTEVSEAFQFERVGFFAVDDDSTPSLKVFNRTVSLVDKSKPNVK